MVRITRRDKEHQRRIATERVEILLHRAREVMKKDVNLARRYTELAWKVAQKHRVKLGKKKYTFCRRCFTPWGPNTVRVRLIHEPYPMIFYKCLHCGAEYRIPIVREKKEGRKTVRDSKTTP